MKRIGRRMAGLLAPRLAARAIVLGMMLASATACDRKPDPGGANASNDDGHSEASPAPSNRVDIPAAVRRNLGITFAKAEIRDVANTVRVPGTFELLPSAQREYRAPLPGRVELVVRQYERVEPGAPLYRLHSAEWLDLDERIAAIDAEVASMGPIRAAHAVHEQSLATKVEIWQDRLAQLDLLREAGGGSAAQFTEARATLNATQAELADVMEKDAELQAQQKRAEAELRSLQARRTLLLRLAGGDEPAAGQSSSGEALVVKAIAGGGGVVESLGVSPGGLAEENALVVRLVQPENVRFRARGLQSDLDRLREGMTAAIVPPFASDSGGGFETIAAKLRLSPVADADDRTIDLIVEPERSAEWARAGVAAQLEVTLSGGGKEIAIPASAVVRDGTTPVIFRRDPKEPDKAIRLEADLGVSDGRWVVVSSGLREGDEVVVAGAYQLMLATSGSAAKGGHFHSDGTFHEGDH